MADETICPRCGYDLRGEMATWETSCPLDGTCTECGLDFEWREILGAQATLPTWCVEYAPRGWRVPVAAVSTLLRTWWPWAFWSRIELTHEVRPRRLIGFVFRAVVVAYFTLGLCHVAATKFAMGVGIVPAVAAARGGFFRPLPPTVREWVALAVTPWQGWFWRHYFAPIVTVVGLLLVIHALSVTGFLALPISRRIAKVRWIHIFRIAMYGATLPLPVLLCWLVTIPVGILDGYFSGPSAQVALLLSMAATAAYVPLHVVWWSVACGRYLRMRHPWGIGLVLPILGILLTMNLLVLVFIVIT